MTEQEAEPGRRTVRASRRVLAVVRTSTSLNRLLDVLPLIDSDSRIEIKFTMDKGSRFGGGVERQLAQLGAEVVPWPVACGAPFDLAVAAHVNRNLAELNGPLLVVPHGVGYNRIVPSSTGGELVPAGLSRAELMSDDGVIPTVIGLSHEEQLNRLRASCPPALSRAAVIGDPTFDRLLASGHRRERYRTLLEIPPECCLVLVSSTWSRHSLFGRHEKLVHRLAAQLPVDQFRVAVILHPNIWFGHSEYEVRAVLRDVLDSGVMIIPPNVWEGGLLAADVVIGDHGSVSFYAVALGVPFLQAADGLAELDPYSPTARLAHAVEKLDVDGDLRTQVTSCWYQPPSAQLAAITNSALGYRGRSWDILRARLYELLRLQPLSASTRMLPVADPNPILGDQVTAYLTSVEVRDEESTKACMEIERYPAIVEEYRGKLDHAELFLVVDHFEVEQSMRQSAEIFVRGEVVSEHEAATWTAGVLTECPGAFMAAVATETGLLLRLRDGRLLEATVGATRLPSAFVAAAATYGWLIGRRPIVSAVRLRTRVCALDTTVVVSPRFGGPNDANPAIRLEQVSPVTAE